MKKSSNAELARIINTQAHSLAAQSFPLIRMALEDKARVLLREGKSLDETLRAIQSTVGAGTFNC